MSAHREDDDVVVVSIPLFNSVVRYICNIKKVKVAHILDYRARRVPGLIPVLGKQPASSSSIIIIYSFI